MATWLHDRPGRSTDMSSAAPIRTYRGWVTQQHLVGRDLERRGRSYLAQGATRAGERCLERAVSHARRAADWELATRGLARLVAVAAGERRWGTAASRSAALVALAEESGSLRALGVALRIRAELLADPRYAAARGVGAGEARATFEAAIAVLEQTRDAVELCLALRALACCLLRAGDKAQALAVVDRAKRLIAH